MRESLLNFLDIEMRFDTHDYEVLETQSFDRYRRDLIQYQGNEGDQIGAYLFSPFERPSAAVLVHHQHNHERHFGKSEVSGLCGDKFQAFCPALAEAGIMALAPDSICFEDRRSRQTGITPGPELDFLQHYNEMCYRLVRGTTLMKKVLEDSVIALNLLLSHSQLDQNKIGILGHSYGGNTVLFHAAIDERIKLICSSGALASYANKMANQTGIEMAEVIPGFVERFDMSDLMKCIAPRKTLILSGSNDMYSKDADVLCEQAQPSFGTDAKANALTHVRFEGGHELDAERFDMIVNWFREVSRT